MCLRPNSTSMFSLIEIEIFTVLTNITKKLVQRKELFHHRSDVLSLTLGVYNTGVNMTISYVTDRSVTIAALFRSQQGIHDTTQLRL